MKKKMNDKIELSMQELKSLFIAGGLFESETIAVDMGERDEVTALDFGDYMKEAHNIEIV